jgi:hypothetical protein
VVKLICKTLQRIAHYKYRHIHKSRCTEGLCQNRRKFYKISSNMAVANLYGKLLIYRMFHKDLTDVKLLINI